jgi:D-amino-acid dehydrogenase
MLLSREGPLFLKWRYLPKLAPWLWKYLKHANEADTRRIAAAVNDIIGDSLADHQALALGTSAERYIIPSDYTYVYRDRAGFEADALSWDIRRTLKFTWTELEGDALRERLPDLGETLGFGILLPGHGRISDPGAYVKALADHFVSQGGRVLQSEVEDVVLENGIVRCVATSDGPVTCHAAVIAGGAWSGKLLKKLGVDVPLESERGYHVEFWNPSTMPSMPLLIASGKFAVTPMDGRLRVAGVVEFGGLDAPPSKAPIEFLKNQVRQAFPSMTWEKTEEWMGHRPAPPDSIPVIGEIDRARGVFAGFGHHHVGLTGGPKTGRLLAQMISGRKANIDLSPYSPNRY